MSDAGYVRIYRALLGHPVFRNDAEALAFAWMVIRASWRPTRVRYKDRVINLERAQLAVSVRDMAKALDRDKAWVERLWNRLKCETMIETRAETGVSIVTICNYDEYQYLDESGETPTATRARQGRDRGETQNKEGNKGISIEEEANASPSKPRAKPKKVASETFPMPADWQPGPLPPKVAELVAQWPPGRFERQVDETRDYWLDRPHEKRPGWDRTLHNRIRDVHDRVMRDSQNGHSGQTNRSPASGYRGPAPRVDGTTAAINDLIDRTRSEHPPEAAGRSDIGSGPRGGELPLARPAALR